MYMVKTGVAMAIRILLPLSLLWEAKNQSIFFPGSTDSRNGGGWKGPLKIILSEPLVKHSHLEPVVDCVQTFSKYL